MNNLNYGQRKFELKYYLKKLGLGKVALYCWHRPLGLVKKSILEGGPLEQIRTERGRKHMVEAAATFPTLLPLSDKYSANVLFLSGKKYWYQTLFCFISLQLRFDYRITPLIFDDGTLDHDVRRLICQVVPWATFVDLSDIESRLDLHLPVKRYPSLRHRRIEYPHLKKLTDLHVGMAGFGLVLDSDMLFYERPDELDQYFKSPSAIYIQDVSDAYGYSNKLMCELAEGPVLSKVNVGLYAFDRGLIDWDAEERWCAKQLQIEGTSYLQEQGITAIELTKQSARPLSSARYIVMPNSKEGRSPTAILHHYVAHSKRTYFQQGWRTIDALIRKANSN